MRTRRILATSVATATIFAFLSTAPPATAEMELIESKPVLAVGYTSADDNRGVEREIANFSAGWRFTFDDPDSFDRIAEKVGVNLDFVVEPMFGVLTAHSSDTVEFSVTPMFHLEPRCDWLFTPYLEGGVGIMYNDLRGFDLGSRILFADQFGVGLYYRLASGTRLGLGYRLRHISHAGLWANTNDGLNTHFAVFTFD